MTRFWRFTFIIAAPIEDLQNYLADNNERVFEYEGPQPVKNFDVPASIQAKFNRRPGPQPQKSPTNSKTRKPQAQRTFSKRGNRTLREAFEARMQGADRGTDDPSTSELYKIAEKMNTSTGNVYPTLQRMGAQGRPVRIAGRKTRRWKLTGGKKAKTGEMTK